MFCENFGVKSVAHFKSGDDKKVMVHKYSTFFNT